MCNIKLFTIAVSVGLLCCSIKLAAQDTAVIKSPDSIEVNVQQKGQYAFVLYAGGGWFSYIGDIGSPGLASTTSIVRAHPVGTVRIMWHPDHRLRFGIESGYNTFYSYTILNGNTRGKVKLTGIPLMAVWSMALTKRLNVFAGIGAYLLTTDLRYKGVVSSNSLSLGFNASVNYVQPVSPKLGVGVELKFTDATQTKDYGMSAQLMLVWKFLEW